MRLNDHDQGIQSVRQVSPCRQRGFGMSGWTLPKASPRREPPQKEIVEFPLALSFAVSRGRLKVGPEWPPKQNSQREYYRGSKTHPANECPCVKVWFTSSEWSLGTKEKARRQGRREEASGGGWEGDSGFCRGRRVPQRLAQGCGSTQNKMRQE